MVESALYIQKTTEKRLECLPDVDTHGEGLAAIFCEEVTDL